MVTVEALLALIAPLYASSLPHSTPPPNPPRKAALVESLDLLGTACAYLDLPLQQPTAAQVARHVALSGGGASAELLDGLALRSHVS
jgi:hypothetical protein